MQEAAIPYFSPQENHDSYGFYWLRLISSFVRDQSSETA